MIIYGWGKDLRKLAYAGIEKCPNCGAVAHFWLCERANNASLYFLKIAKWNRQFLLMCQSCENGWEILPELRDETLRRTLALPSPEECEEIFGYLEKRVLGYLQKCSTEGAMPSTEHYGKLLKEACS